MMVRKELCIILFLVFTFFVACRGGGVKNTDQQPEQQVIEQVIEFSKTILESDRAADTVNLGKILAGEVKSKVVEFRNVGEEAFAVLNIDTTCGCVEFDYPRNPLKPQEGYVSRVEFDSKGEQGRVHKVVSIATSLSGRSKRLVFVAEIE